MKALSLLLVSLSLLFSLETKTVEQNLVDAGHAEVVLQTMVEDGYIDDAIIFAKKANEKYADNILLLTWSGQAYLEKDDLEVALKYYKQVLDLDPSNEIAKMKIEFIDDQESAKENKNIATILEWLIDKGLDFLMIFLAFLGGEIIAKRYNSCQNNYIYTLVYYFLQDEKLYNSWANRLEIMFSQGFKQRFSPFCLVINFLIIVTIVVAMMIVWLFIAFHFEIDFLLDEPLLTVGTLALDFYFVKLFALFFIITITVRKIMQYNKIPTSRTACEIELVEELDSLLENRAYRVLHQVIQDLEEKDISKLVHKYSSDADAILKFKKGEN
jgi:hypothetical protein